MCSCLMNERMFPLKQNIVLAEVALAVDVLVIAVVFVKYPWKWN